MWPFSTDLFSSALGIFGEIFGPSGIEITELEKKNQTNKQNKTIWVNSRSQSETGVRVFFLWFGMFCSPFNSKFIESQQKCSLRKYLPLNLTRRSIALFSWALIGWCGLSCFCCDSIWVSNLYHQKNTTPLNILKYLMANHVLRITIHKASSGLISALVF